MNPHPDAGFELDDVLLRATRREATPAELQQLERYLLASEAARVDAWRFLCNDALLSEHISASHLNDELRNLLADSTPRSAPGVKRTVSPLRRVLNAVDRHGLRVFAIAASLMVALLVNQFAMQSKVDRLHALALVAEGAVDPPGPAGAVSDADSGLPLAVGRVSGLRDVAWGPEQRALRFGDPIRPGQNLRIESGVVELLLTNGAKITLEGPADFEPSSALEAHLGLGKIAAAAPRTARGYTVFTPTAELCDIGTQFGVVVEGSGDSELHVFDGDVVARARTSGADSKLLHARENEAMRFRKDAAAPELIDARSAEFVRYLVPTPPLADLPPLPVTSGLVAWYDASVSTDAEVGEPVPMLRDILVGDNDYADDAWQFDPPRRPRLVRDGQGRPALRFDGKATCLSTSPVETGDAETVFLAFAPAPIVYAQAPQGSTLLAYGGDPRLELTLGRDFIPRGAILTGSDSRSIGAVRGSALDPGQVAVVGFSYDSTRNRSELWINGVSQGESGAVALAPSSAKRILGALEDQGLSSGYFGTIYEVVLYGRSLPADEIERLRVYFDRRYDKE
ncbi:MAG: hypothetical protein ACRCT8_15770 [Lacipirellulaceae bacterium]